MILCVQAKTWLNCVLGSVIGREQLENLDTKPL